MAKDSPVKRRRLVAPQIGHLTQGARDKSRSPAPGEQLHPALSTTITPPPEQDNPALRTVEFGRAEHLESQNSTTWVEMWHPDQYNSENQKFELSLQTLTSEFFGYDVPTGAGATAVVPQIEPLNDLYVFPGQSAVAASDARTGQKRRRDECDDMSYSSARKTQFENHDLRYLPADYAVKCPLPLMHDPNKPCEVVISLDAFTSHLREEHKNQGCTLKNAKGEICGFNHPQNFRRHLLGTRHSEKVYGHKKLANITEVPLEELPPIACRHCKWKSSCYIGGDVSRLTNHILQCPALKLARQLEAAP